MTALPRLALATSAAGPEPGVAAVALLSGLSRLGWRVQHFRSWACPVTRQVVGPITGLPGRHLDAWLMPPAICAGVFWRGSRGSDLAVVEGTLEEPVAAPVVDLARLRDYSYRPGRLGPLIELLDLPRVAVVDCRGWAEPHLPYIPDWAEAVIFDGVEQPELFELLGKLVRHVRGLPVLGGVEALPGLRDEFAELPLGSPLPEAMLERLGRSFLRFADLEAIAAVAGRPYEVPGGMEEGGKPRVRHRVAYAMDEAFGGYYPDTLEALEALGAELVEFSPLRDGGLPSGVDLVMIGCGIPDRFVAELSANHSLLLELRARTCRGLRIYAEGGGAAYLGRSMIVEGRSYGGAGILPFDARLRSEPAWPEPVERVTSQDGWLGPRGTVVRGYTAYRWELTPAPEPEDCPRRSGTLTAEGDVYFRCNAVGSLVHLHLPALPEIVRAFGGLAAAGTGRAAQGGRT
ncbi:MAG: cobyrinic acid a,c-diamide synthase [Isosphaeraceae bacterium]|jgi:cobyrinic acid a,c-diamide synthase|nr:MAG: cobyrinic acid a,c-diamide synthase [Isosphaeraceae bacterium]